MRCHYLRVPMDPWVTFGMLAQSAGAAIYRNCRMGPIYHALVLFYNNNMPKKTTKKRSNIDIHGCLLFLPVSSSLFVYTWQPAPPTSDIHWLCQYFQICSGNIVFSGLASEPIFGWNLFMVHQKSCFTQQAIMVWKLLLDRARVKFCCSCVRVYSLFENWV